jgi:hypothetical protein
MIMFKIIKAHILVSIAILTNNCFGKTKNLHGKKYKEACKEFGYRAMIKEYLTDNSWEL